VTYRNPRQLGSPPILWQHPRNKLKKGKAASGLA
jgi:hypothetical protein